MKKCKVQKDSGIKSVDNTKPQIAKKEKQDCRRSPAELLTI